MRRRKFIFGVLVLSVCGVLTVMFWPEKEIPEPAYKGKKLGQWLDQAAAQQTFTMEITEALQAIGTNAVPCYLHWMSHERSLMKRLGSYITLQTKGWPHVNSAPGTPKEMRAFYAFHALGQLGESGAPAIPQLLVYAKRPPPLFPSSAVKSPGFALKAFGMMGQPGMAAYLSLVTNENARIRAMAIGQSRRFSRSLHQFPEITAQFEKRQADPDFQVRVAATNALKLPTPIAARPETP